MSNKLTIELVPATSWYTNVRKNADGSTWDTIRHKCYREANYICEICGDIGPQWPVECHEKWEYDDKNHIQKLIGFIALCPNCHMVKHIGLATKKGKSQEAMEHMMKVNNLERDEATYRILEAFNKWSERSNYPWDVDISYVNEYLK